MVNVFIILQGFTAGFTNAQKLDDDQIKAAAYLTKYITKDMLNRFNSVAIGPLRIYTSL